MKGELRDRERERRGEGGKMVLLQGGLATCRRGRLATVVYTSSLYCGRLELKPQIPERVKSDTIWTGADTPTLLPAGERARAGERGEREREDALT